MTKVRGIVGIVVSAVVALAVAGCGPAQVSRAVDHAGHQAAANVPPPAPLRAGERFLQLSMARPYTPEPPTEGGTDEYRCFLLDPQLSAKAFVTGSQFIPQNAKIVHHAIFFRVPPNAVGKARALDDETPGDGWTCFGGTGVAERGPGDALSNAAWIAAWAPGGTETLLKSRTGYEMQPGSQVIMQIHYNLLATGGKAAGADRSGIRLRLMDGGADLNPLQTTLVPAPVELPCPAGETGRLCDRDRSVLDVRARFGSRAAALVAGLWLLCTNGKAPTPGSTQHCDMRVRQAGTVYAVAGHMHLLGRSIKVELNPGTPRAKVLLDVPVYNFDDQSARPLAQPVTVKPGDTYRVTCTHDASLRRKLPELQPLPPRYVVWGEGTSDEMCLGIVIWSAG